MIHQQQQQQPPQPRDTYTFSSQPRAIKQRKQYRNVETAELSAEEAAIRYGGSDVLTINLAYIEALISSYSKILL